MNKIEIKSNKSIIAKKVAKAKILCYNYRMWVKML